MIDLELSNFQKPFNHLNGKKVLRINRLDLARSMITMGHSSWSKIFKVGIFRVGELFCKTFAFTEMDKGNLILNDSFYKLPPSDKGTVSYYLGQSFTKLVAENLFHIPWLLHVDDYVSNITFSNQQPFSPKKIISPKDKKGGQPDLIGILGKNKSHVFEAKGRSSGGYRKDVMQTAINQVSKLLYYNNVKPLTKNACYFDLAQKPIKGTIIDPDKDANISYSSANEEVLLAKYYSFFIQNEEYFTLTHTVNDFRFKIVALPIENLYFGIDERIFLQNYSLILERGLYLNNELFEDNISIGLDGIILMKTEPNNK